MIDINKRVYEHNYTMSELHAHSHYEIYYLTRGTRMFFLENMMYEIREPALIIIPPHVMHKTEGESFTRYNIIVSPKRLNSFQLETLDKFKLLAIKPSPDDHAQFEKLLETAVSVPERKNKPEILDALFGYFIFILDRLNYETINSIQSPKQTSPLMLKVMAYMHNHYSEKITLDIICEKFFVSKTTLNYNFQNYCSCPPMEYLLRIRLTKAQELLLKTTKSIEQIASECGFSSPNYFGLIFKKYIHMSPSGYRHTYQY